MSEPIVIAAHWHTGSSIIARAFRLCGMEVGNEATKWFIENNAQTEHGILNRIGDAIYNGETVDYTESVRRILTSYKIQSEINNWDYFGIKITHILQDKCWKFFKPIIDEQWPGTQYIIPVRHPYDICLSTRDDKWTERMILDSWKSTEKAIFDLIYNYNAKVLDFPICFMISMLKEVIEDIGMKWNNKIMDEFDFERVFSIRNMEWERIHPNSTKLYRDLQKYA